jgi:3-hydroxybutyryl-CoA dehydratase
MNKVPIASLHQGDTAQMTRQFTELDVVGFSRVTGDVNPAHLDETYAATTPFKTRIVHGMLVGSLFSAIFGTELPGLGTIYVNQTLKFTKPVYLNDVVTAKVTLKEFIPDRGRVIFDCVATNQNNEVVLIGEAILIPPK